MNQLCFCVYLVGALLTFFVLSGHDAFLGVRYEVLKPRHLGEVAAIADYH